MLSHFSHVWLCNPMDCSLPGSSVHGIFQQEYWKGFPFPSPGDLPNPGIEPVSLMSFALSLAGRFFTTSITWEAPTLLWGARIFSNQHFSFFFFPDIYPEAELLDHMIALFLVFWGISILFSIVAIPAYLPMNSVQEFPLLHILPNICYL